MIINQSIKTTRSSRVQSKTNLVDESLSDLHRTWSGVVLVLFPRLGAEQFVDGQVVHERLHEPEVAPEVVNEVLAPAGKVGSLGTRSSPRTGTCQ